MKKNILIILTLSCIILIFTNLFQFNRIKQYATEEKSYTESFENYFNSFIDSLNYYDGETSVLSNECAIKNSISIISSVRNKCLLSKYKDNKPLSLMLLNLDKFFVMNSNEFINNNINNIKPLLTNISKNLNDEKSITELNLLLENLKANT